MHILDVLKERGFIAQTTFEDELYKQLEEPTTFYVGFDPTADSLHIGHYIPIMAMAHMQRAGHRPIALMGGGTAMIGDPSGKTDMRKMMTVETIDHNVECIKQQMSRFLDFSDEKAIIVNNADWLRNLNFIEFMRDIGAMFSVNKMLTADCYKTRMATDNGLSFLEFTYMLMQSYDFLKLYRDHDCILQVGGSDQWSNMLGGYELVRRKEDAKVYSMTIPLLVNADGVKMGKSMGNAVWLDENKTSPFDLYQYFRNVDDRDVKKFMLQLTFLSLDEIDKITSEEDINRQKEILAYEITKDVHGKEAADQAIETARKLFSGKMDLENMPAFEIERAKIADGIGILSLMVEAGLAKSNGEARKLIQGGGVSIDDEKITDPQLNLTADKFDQEFVIKKGKKTFLKITAKYILKTKSTPVLKADLLFLNFK